jgi:hypothetical protein
MRYRSSITVILIALIAAWTGVASGQLDPERRTTLEAGVEGPIRGNGPLGGDAFLLVNRPQFPAEDFYTRVVIAPGYVTSELVRDGWPAPGNALGIGLSGGLWAYNFDEFRDGDYKRRESFWGHEAAASFSYFWRQLKIAGVVPVEGQLRLRPQYVVYDDGLDTTHAFRLPEDTAIYTARGGIRVGGVPPELFPEKALEVSLWHEASYRDTAGRFGLPERPLETEHFTQRSWARAGGILTPWQGHTFSLFLTGGVAEDTDVLSVFRLGGTLGFRSELPLILHGYNAGEVFARRFGLVNASYRLPPVPGLERVRLQLSGDYARVDYFSGHSLPHHGLVGAGADVSVALTERAIIGLGYGYGFDAPRGDHFGGQEVHAVMELKF